MRQKQRYTSEPATCHMVIGEERSPGQMVRLVTDRDTGRVTVQAAITFVAWRDGDAHFDVYAMASDRHMTQKIRSGVKAGNRVMVSKQWLEEIPVAVFEKFKKLAEAK